MAVSYSNPEFSFMQFVDDTPETCAVMDRPCLPVYGLADLQFQVFAEVDGADKETFLDQLVSASIVTDCDQANTFFRSYIANWELISAGAYDNPDLYVGYFSENTSDGFDQYPVGTCFTLKLYKEFNDDPLTCFETCLVKIADPCFTSILAYRNNSNAFDFNYDTPTYNRVRLPFYLHSPVDAEDSKNYAKSDGTTTQLSYRLWKDFKVKTDYMPGAWLERFTVGTAHDDVRITCTYSGLNQEAVVWTEKVDIAWREEEVPLYRMAQGATVLRLAAARANVNSNCA